MESQRGTGHAVTAGFLGWTLDAFDFFVVIFLYDVLAAQFHVEKSALLWATTATLAFRPVGALIFGMLADRFGRRTPLLAIYVRTHVPESEAWRQHRVPNIRAIFETVGKQWKLFAYLVLLMTLFMFLSHGTQDLYPDFLKIEHGLTPKIVANMAILYNIGAVVGAIVFGHLSEKLGRRYSILAALGLSLAMIPTWAFGETVVILALGAFAMQMGVQGAWGIVPAHLNEVSPDAVRGLVPGLAYQLGILIASPTSNIEHKLRDLFGYSWALAAFEITVIIALGVVTWAGKENKGKIFAASQL